MKKTFNIDEKLFKEAKVACGASTDTETAVWALRLWCATPPTSAYERFVAWNPARKMCPGVVSDGRQNARWLDGPAGHFDMDSVPREPGALRR